MSVFLFALLTSVVACAPGEEGEECTAVSLLQLRAGALESYKSDEAVMALLEIQSENRQEAEEMGMDQEELAKDIHSISSISQLSTNIASKIKRTFGRSWLSADVAPSLLSLMLLSVAVIIFVYGWYWIANQHDLDVYMDSEPRPHIWQREVYSTTPERPVFGTAQELEPERRSPQRSPHSGRNYDPQEMYWVQYNPHLNELDQMCQWTPAQQHQVHVLCCEWDNPGGDPMGYLSWPHGEVRQVVMQYFTRVGHLPAPQLSLVTWDALWGEVARDGQDSVPYSLCMDFTRIFTRTIRDMLTKTRIPVEISPCVWVPWTPPQAPPVQAVHAVQLEPAPHASPDISTRSMKITNQPTDFTPMATAQSWHEPYAEHETKIRELVDAWGNDSIASTIQGIFRDVDADGDGSLEWNNSEVQNFVKHVFDSHGIPLPDLSESQWYQLYRQFRGEHATRLSTKDAIAFAKFMHEEIARKEVDWEHMGSHAPVLVANERGTYVAVRQEELGNAVPVRHAALAAKVARCHDWRNNCTQSEAAKAQEKVETWGSSQEGMHALFAAADNDGDAHLDWNHCELRAFTRRAFQALGLPEPLMPEAAWYQIYREVEGAAPSLRGVDEIQAMEFVRRVLQRILVLRQAQFIPVHYSAASISA